MRTSIITILTILTVSCGDITIKDNQAKADIDADLDESGKVDYESSKTEKKVKKTKVIEYEEVVTTYTLKHPSGLTDRFISPNYCLGFTWRECHLSSAILVEYGDGRFFISLEFMDSSNPNKYSIESEILDRDQAILLSDNVLLADDDDIMAKRYLWAIVRVEDMSLELIYDYLGSGPNEQGTDSLDTYYFDVD
jgi:hypothetical protein